jgi:hypothetical protein
MQVPCPARVKVQMVLSKTRAALTAENRLLQSALVKVLRVTHWRLAAADPGWLVCPQPDAITEAPPPRVAEAKTAGAIAAVVPTLTEVWSKEMSLARVFALYDGWLTIRLTAKVVPPLVRLMAPITTMVLPVVRPIVQ